nr:putative sulfate exporter family transporter [Sinorhizobium meliloti]
MAVLIAISAQFLSEHYGAPATLMALLLGMSLNFLSESGARTVPGIHFASRAVLRFGVALLGARVSLEVLSDLSVSLLCLVTTALACTILFAIIVGKFAGMDWRLSLLTGGADKSARTQRAHRLRFSWDGRRRASVQDRPRPRLPCRSDRNSPWREPNRKEAPRLLRPLLASDDHDAIRGAALLLNPARKR